MIDQLAIKVNNKIVVKEENLTDLIEKAKDTIESNLQTAHDNMKLKEQIEHLTSACDHNDRTTSECMVELSNLEEEHQKVKFENAYLRQENKRAKDELNDASLELAKALAEATTWKAKITKSNLQTFEASSRHSDYQENKDSNEKDKQSLPENKRTDNFDAYIGRDETEWTNTFLEEKTKPLTNRVNVNNLKVSLKIPIWENSPSIDKTSSLNDFIDKLRYFRSMNILSDAQTIYSSLEASSRIDILRELDRETLKDIDKFVKYLRMAHGGSSLKQRSNLESLIQSPIESALSFFKRVIREYYLSKGLEPRDPKDITEKDRQEDIVYHFSRGLRNNTTGTQIRMNRLTTNFEKLGEIANHIDQALEPINSINNVQLIEQINKLSLNEPTNHVNAVDRNYNPDYNKSRQCWTCGFYGHQSRDCYANQRTQGRYSRQNRSRSQGRNQRNDRSKSPYRRSYDNRGRSPYRGSRDNRGRQNTPYNRDRRGRSDSHGSSRGRSASYDKNRKNSRDYRNTRTSGSRERRDSGNRDRQNSRDRRSNSRESRAKW